MQSSETWSYGGESAEAPGDRKPGELNVLSVQVCLVSVINPPERPALLTSAMMSLRLGLGDAWPVLVRSFRGEGGGGFQSFVNFCYVIQMAADQQLPRPQTRSPKLPTGLS